MEIKSFASPSSLVGLTSALSKTTDPIVGPTIDSRLASAGLGRTWLEQMCDNFSSLAADGQDYELDRGLEYCQLLSWICAPLKGNSSWININEEATRITADFYSKMSLTSKPNLRLLCWVASFPLDVLELNYPSLLIFEDIDPDLELAYLNLLDHLREHSWTGDHREVDTTSLTLRLGGMINSLEHNKDLGEALQARVIKLKGIIPESDAKIYNGSDWIKNFVKVRNAVAHVSEKGSYGYSLTEAWERTKDIDHMRSIVRLCSYLMADEVRGNLHTIPDSHVKSWVDRVNEEMIWRGFF